MFAGDISINRFAGLPPEYITIEYSRNNGQTWTKQEVDNVLLNQLFSTQKDACLYIGGYSDYNNISSSNDQTKITIEIPKTRFKFYANIRKFYLFVSTNGASMTVDITASETLSSSNPATKEITKDRVINGWSGYNTINCDVILGGNANYGYSKLEFIFKQKLISSTAPAQIYSIFAYCGNVYQTPSNLANTGHLYRWQGTQNAIFPQSVFVNDTFSSSNMLLPASEIDSRIAASWEWGEY